MARVNLTPQNKKGKPLLLQQEVHRKSDCYFRYRYSREIMPDL
jgi:hypothetical protein